MKYFALSYLYMFIAICMLDWSYGWADNNALITIPAIALIAYSYFTLGKHFEKHKKSRFEHSAL